MNRPHITTAALGYLELGWSFYPTRPRSKEPFTEICPRWKPYQTQPPTERDAAIWFQIAPNANLALITGRVSGLVILDCDSPEAEAALHDFCGGLPLTPCVLSKRGTHFYFAHPLDREVRGSLDIPDMDVKGDGGCCTAPPSVHSSGYVYGWIKAPDDVPLAPLPAPILEHLDAKAALRHSGNFSGEIPAFRHSDITAPYARVALQNAVAEIAATRKGRHNTIRGVAYSIGRLVGGGALDAATAFGALLPAALQTGKPLRECQRLIQDELEAGRKNPRFIETSARPAPKRALPSLNQLRGTAL